MLAEVEGRESMSLMSEVEEADEEAAREGMLS